MNKNVRKRLFEFTFLTHSQTISNILCIVRTIKRISFNDSNQKAKSFIVTEVKVMSPFITYISQNSEVTRYGSDTDKKEIISDVKCSYN